MPRRGGWAPLERVAVGLGVLGILAAALAVRSATVRSLDRLATDRPLAYWVAPGDGVPGFRAEDDRLARLAVAAWDAGLGDAVTFVEAPAAADALIRLEWVAGTTGRFGDMRPIFVDGRRGAAVRVRARTTGDGPAVDRRAGEDPLFRATVIYLTCLHELGHALGLSHSGEAGDVMVDFGTGDAAAAFFARYRSRIVSRDDIARHAGLSAGDLRRIRRLYGLAAAR